MHVLPELATRGRDFYPVNEFLFSSVSVSFSFTTVVPKLFQLSFLPNPGGSSSCRRELEIYGAVLSHILRVVASGLALCFPPQSWPWATLPLCVAPSHFTWLFLPRFRFQSTQAVLGRQARLLHLCHCLGGHLQGPAPLEEAEPKKGPNHSPP